MELQEIMVLVAVGLALTYLSVRVYRTFDRKNCRGACKGCSSINFSKIDLNGPKH